MSYDVTSWFQVQIEDRASEPKRVFTIGSSDYSDRVTKWPVIRRAWDSVRPQTISLRLANDDQGMNFLQAQKWKLTEDFTIKLGFTHPTSGDELITLYSGQVDKVRFSGTICSLTLVDKFRQLSERVIGSPGSPVTFTDSSLPSDIAWTAVTCYGGYSSVQSTSNPDVNWEDFQAWAEVFSTDAVYMNAQIEGQKVAEILQRISRNTLSAIFIEGERLTFDRFSAADILQSTFNTDVNIGDVELLIDDELISNKQYVYGAYDPSSNTWAIVTHDENTSSVNTYGLHEQVAKDDAIWYVNSGSAINFAQRMTFSRAEPYDQITSTVGLNGILRQIGETVLFSEPFFQGALNAGYRVMGYELDTQEGTYQAQLDRSQYANPFILDTSTLDGSDLLL